MGERAPLEFAILGPKHLVELFEKPRGAPIARLDPAARRALYQRLLDHSLEFDAEGWATARESLFADKNAAPAERDWTENVVFEHYLLIVFVVMRLRIGASPIVGDSTIVDALDIAIAILITRVIPPRKSS